MNKFLIIASIAFSIFSAFAQELTCLDKLLPNNRYSGVHQVMKEEWSDDSPELNNVNGKSVLAYLFRSKLFCKDQEYKIVIEPFCTRLGADLPKSNTCFAHTSLGYFVFTRDQGKNTNFIFSRDKTYSEP